VFYSRQEQEKHANVMVMTYPLSCRQAHALTMGL